MGYRELHRESAFQARSCPIALSSYHICRNLAATAMLDTIVVRLRCPFKITLPGRQKVNLVRGMKVWADLSGQRLEKAELSLPKLLFGHNGYVLSTQSDIDAALERAHGFLKQVADVPQVLFWDVRRVDIAWNFALDALPLILVHASLRVRGIRSAATLHKGGQGVSWLGSRSKKAVKLYDKARQMHVRGSVLRAEVGFRSDQVSRYLPGQDWRDFNRLYEVYRSVLATIPSINSPAKAANLLEAVGLEPFETRTRILARLRHRNSRTFRHYRQQIEASAARLERPFSWTEFLPKTGPPAPVNVTPRRRTQLRHSGRNAAIPERQSRKKTTAPTAVARDEFQLVKRAETEFLP